MDYLMHVGPTAVAILYTIFRIETRLRRIEILCKSRGHNCEPIPTETAKQADQVPLITPK